MEHHDYFRESQKNLMLIGVSIRSVGFFSKAVRQFLSLNDLLLMFDNLILLCENKILKYLFLSYPSRIIEYHLNEIMDDDV